MFVGIKKTCDTVSLFHQTQTKIHDYILCSKNFGSGLDTNNCMFVKKNYINTNADSIVLQLTNLQVKKINTIKLQVYIS